MKTIYFAMSRKANKAEIMTGFTCWEHLQGALMCGIMLSDGTPADGIGKCPNAHAFLTRASSGATLVIHHHEIPARLEIMTNGEWVKVTYSIWRSYNGKRRVDGKRFMAPSYYYLSSEIAPEPRRAA